MQAGHEAAAATPHHERHAVPVLELLLGWSDVGWVDVDAGQTAKILGDDARLGVELCGVLEVLELATAADIEVRARRFAPLGRRFDDP